MKTIILDADDVRTCDEGYHFDVWSSICEELGLNPNEITSVKLYYPDE